ncbi:hypothetical protein DDE18_16455 [Nocardioides gansuensis]|uniref:Major facilitator superfamily (MFS) profile domain-containing protein n=1 Tax=Nocardioides gansuensis TaxID=2138300 RepID=A0A2T8F7A6_9ACTN|nr:MFS transporter [Nocardioides gansuensis]PVG81596.1 hypothetical protein DDE18_16455 [Nocardioides gansuensis]
MATAARTSLLTPAFVALAAVDLLYFTAAGIMLAATPLFTRDVLGAGNAGVGVVVGAFGVTTLLTRPFAGRATDRRGRRGLLVVGAGAMCVLTLAHLLVDSVPALVALRLLLGVAEALFIVAGFAALADLAPPGRSGEALSLNSLALYLGIALGPGLGQILIEAAGFAAAWVAAAALFGVSAVVILALVPETLEEPEDATPSALVSRAALWPAFLLFAGVAATGGFLGFGVLHAREVGLAAWGLAPLVFGATVVTLRIAFATLADRTEPMRLAAVALLLDAAGLVVMGAVASPVGVLLGALLLGIGSAFLTPAVFAAVFSRVAPAQRGSAAATTSVLIDLGLSGGPLVVGLVAAGIGLGPALVAIAALPLAVGGIALARQAGRKEAVRTAP